MAIAAVSLLLAIDPGLGVRALEATLVVEGDLGLGQHGGDKIEIFGLELIEQQSRRFEDWVYYQTAFPMHTLRAEPRYSPNAGILENPARE